jgi:HAMP domain-containing protein
MSRPEVDRRTGWTRFLVPDPAFSWYMRTITLGSVVVALFFTAVLWWYHGKLLDLLGLYDLLDDPAVHEMVAEYSKLSLVVILLSVATAAGFLLVMALFLLHRISGPIYRMKAHMMELAAGAPPRPLRFRTDDQLADLADIFNDLMRHYGLLEGSGATHSSAEPAADDAAAGRLPEPARR